MDKKMLLLTQSKSAARKAVQFQAERQQKAGGIQREGRGCDRRSTNPLIRDGSAQVIERAQEALAKGMKLLAERQKLIKIADRSEYGWGVIVEYTADDEKRLEKAEKAAERKAAKRKRKRAESSVKTGKGRYSTLQSALSGPAPVAAASTTYPSKRSQLLPAPM